MSSENQSGGIRFLATVLALIGGYCAIRVALIIPAFRELMMNSDMELPQRTVGTLILAHPHAFVALVIAVLITTLLAIHLEFKNHKLIYSCGIVLLFIFADRAAAGILEPIIRMISLMGNQ